MLKSAFHFERKHTHTPSVSYNKLDIHIKCLERGKLCHISISLSVHEKVQIKMCNTDTSSKTRVY